MHRRKRIIAPSSQQMMGKKRLQMIVNFKVNQVHTTSTYFDNDKSTSYKHIISQYQYFGVNITNTHCEYRWRLNEQGKIYSP